ncbi:RagB/SusD family nutrient uptake outer membrane protein [Sphingobacterium corticibacterium]|uniref:RagB/SusD family nutrient uptake outer membrane protein n=1 Tax=Sphingobacterium corticibacterium TaxID=2484746 RepID=A0A4Q6XGW7_9SPHI|nr:RagB/SusD family nutrient uptake outer membrane protein [Sphingobacterium corticibacterium]RZF58315.1 RagB/SusD family nutrient uptake outer membrane protein [Sphingobacterium corticibacterium]
MEGITKVKYSVLAVAAIIFTSCVGSLLDKQPLTSIASENFWTTSNDAYLALAGVYSKSTTWTSSEQICAFDANSDNGINRKPNAAFLTYGNLNTSTSEIKSYWNGSYREIAAANFFLENIDQVSELDDEEKNQLKAEVRFLRAFTYFNLYSYWGDVPLVTKLLDQNEANTVSVTDKTQVYEFLLTELSEIAPYLPETRPGTEHGRILKGAALALKGRLLMWDKKWQEAAQAFEAVIESGVHVIDNQYEELFNGKNENSREIIFSRKYLEGEVTNPTQLYYRPSLGGGWHHLNPSQDLVDSYLCIDGLPIGESPLYDVNYPVVKNGVNYRDPRLTKTIFYPGISLLNNVLYQGHPDSTSVIGDVFTYDAGMTGYCLQKYVDNTYNGDLYNSGVDIPVIRYAEVLLSYLECQIMAGEAITTALLDLTINSVRRRATVNMPDVTEKNSNLLLEIVKRERRVELAFEGLRYWDLARWGEVDERLSNKVLYGIKLTNDPSSYTRFPVGPQGHYKVLTLKASASDLPWPIPQDEIDINRNLEQKENWK